MTAATQTQSSFADQFDVHAAAAQWTAFGRQAAERRQQQADDDRARRETSSRARKPPAH